MAQRKLFLGARLKRLRRERGLNQSQMADELGISASYLNHLERNQRPVTAGVLLRPAEAFDVDVKAFASEAGDSARANQLAEISSEPLRRRLKDAWGVEVRVVGPEILEDASQHYDPQRRLLMLSSLLRPENRQFGIAYQLALLEFAPIIARMLEAAHPPDPGSRRLLHMSFANYAAGAVIMPYGKFLRAAEEYRYALDRLTAQFGANVEQVAHRLTTLSRSGAKGVPFFMLRVDPAGNISKRYAGESFPFSHFGGTCPRWHLHSAFQTPGQTLRQLIETPDGERFFTISRTIERPIRPDLRDDALLAIGLGCDVKHAQRIAYADGLDLANTEATPVGPPCAICPRPQRPYRATPPAGRMLAVEENRKSIAPYPFVPT